MTALIVALKKAAFLLLTDKRARTGILSVIIGIFGVILIIFGTLFTLSTVEIEHRKEITDYIFNENIPVESIINDFPHYCIHITESRKYLRPIAEEAERLNEESGEENKLDTLKIKVIYYALFLENALRPATAENEYGPEESPTTPSEPPPKLPLVFENLPDTDDYISCFYERTAEEFKPVTDEKNCYSNLETLIKRPITAEEKARIDEIYNCLNGENIPPLAYSGEYSPPLSADIFSCITSQFGYRKDPFTGRTSYHNGTDFAYSGCYAAPIYAVADGTVTRAHDAKDGFGICVVIDHGGGVQTYYAHCSSVNTAVGDTVKAGQAIAKIGSTGRSTGNHLHLGLKVNGGWQEPLSLFRP